MRSRNFLSTWGNSRVPAVVMILLAFGASCGAAAAVPESAQSARHYLFVWAGDRDLKGNDFLAVIDASPASPAYGRIVTSLGTDQRTVRVHHTEYSMPASGMLFANDHDAGRTFIFDVRDAIHPRIATSFSEVAGYMHPHSYVRLPNGHVLVTFQHRHGAGDERTGGLVEIDDTGHVVRSASSADPAFPDALLTPYGVLPIPGIDRAVSTNSSMHIDGELFSGVTYQVWRLSALKLLNTGFFAVAPDHYAHIAPEEPRLAPDGSVFVQTLGCGLERLTNIASARPRAELVYKFPGNWCGVPTVVGRYLVQSVPAVHGFIVLNLTDSAHPVEVSRLTLSPTYRSHWTSWDPGTQRLVVTSGSTPGDRTYLLKLDTNTGALSVDTGFRDMDGEVGFSFAERDWPHGWRGVGMPHGAVFSR